jgi:hypothetical protein
MAANNTRESMYRCLSTTVGTLDNPTETIKLFTVDPNTDYSVSVYVSLTSVSSNTASNTGYLEFTAAGSKNDATPYVFAKANKLTGITAYLYFYENAYYLHTNVSVFANIKKSINYGWLADFSSSVNSTTPASNLLATFSDYAVDLNVDQLKVKALEAVATISGTNITDNGNTTIKGALGVSGVSTTKGITNNGDLTVSGTTALNGTTTTKGVSVNGDLSVSGSSTTRGVSNTGTISSTDSISTGNQLKSTVADGKAPLVVTSTTKVANLNADLLDDHDSLYFATDANLTAEITRAQAAEKKNSDAITAEAGRAQAAESLNAANITNEVTRAQAAESANSTAIAQETTDRKSADSTITTSLNSEVSRAKAAEELNATNISTNKANIATNTTNIATNAKNIADEIFRAEAAESANATAISNETTARTDADATIDNKLSEEISRAKTADDANSKAITDETTRATGIESNLRTDVDANTTAISDEATARTNADTTLNNNLNNEVTRAKKAEDDNLSAAKLYTDDIKTLSKLESIGASGITSSVNGSLAVKENLSVSGNLTVAGTTTTINATNLEIADNLIILAKGNDAALGFPAGLVVPKYDGTNYGALVYDKDGFAYVGDVALNNDGQIDLTSANTTLQTIATRNSTFNNGAIAEWDNTNKKFVSQATVGNSTTPVYISENGVVTAGISYQDALVGSADKLNISDAVGSETVPVYFKNGVPVAITSLGLNASSATKVNNNLSFNTTTDISKVSSGSYNGSSAQTITSYKPDQNLNTTDSPSFNSLSLSSLSLSSTSTTASPLTVKSQVLVEHLNADMLDGNHSDYFATANNLKTATDSIATLQSYFSSGAANTATKTSKALTLKDASGTEQSFDGSTAIDLSDGVDYATKAGSLNTPRTISISEGATGTATVFDGSKDIIIPITSLDAAKLSGTATISTTGNAGTVTNGVYTTGNQTISGVKTFSSTISGSISGNSETVTNGVYTVGNQTIDGVKTFSKPIVGTLNGNATSATTAIDLTGAVKKTAGFTYIYNFDSPADTETENKIFNVATKEYVLSVVSGGTVSISSASTNIVGGIKLFNTALSTSITSLSSGATADRYYPVQLDSAGKAFVNIPWTDNNTTYTADGNVLQLVGTQFSVVDGGITNSKLANKSITLNGASVDLGGTLTLGSLRSLTAGSGLTGSITDGSTTGTISHADTSTVTDLTSASRRYVSGLTFDTFGHVTGYTTGTESDQTIPTLSLGTQSGTGNVVTGIAVSNHTITVTKGIDVYTKTEVDNKINPGMEFVGTLGTGGTVSSLPTTAAQGNTYKVITAGIYASQSAKVGDIFIALKDSPVNDTTGWVLVPSGDDIEDSWREIQVNGTTLLGNSITSGVLNFASANNGTTIAGSGNTITMTSAVKFDTSHTLSLDTTDWN